MPNRIHEIKLNAKINPLQKKRQSRARTVAELTGTGRSAKGLLAATRPRSLAPMQTRTAPRRSEWVKRNCEQINWNPADIHKTRQENKHMQPNKLTCNLYQKSKRLPATRPLEPMLPSIGCSNMIFTKLNCIVKQDCKWMLNCTLLKTFVLSVRGSKVDLFTSSDPSASIEETATRRSNQQHENKFSHQHQK